MDGLYVELEEAKAFLRQAGPRGIPDGVWKVACRDRNYRMRVGVALLATPLLTGWLVYMLAADFPSWRVLIWIAAALLLLDCVGDLIFYGRRIRAIRKLLEEGRPATARLAELAEPGLYENYEDRPFGPRFDVAMLKARLRFYDETGAERTAETVPLCLGPDVERLRAWACDPGTVLHILYHPEVKKILLVDLWVRP